MQLVSLKDKLERARATMANVREKAKAGTKLVVHTALGAATAGAIGAWDQAKGVNAAHDPAGTPTMAYVGPLPASLAIAGIAKVAAFWQLGDETGELASAIGQGALDAWSYVTGRKLWIQHAAKASG